MNQPTMPPIPSEILARDTAFQKFHADLDLGTEDQAFLDQFWRWAKRAYDQGWSDRAEYTPSSESARGEA